MMHAGFGDDGTDDDVNDNDGGGSGGCGGQGSNSSPNLRSHCALFMCRAEISE